MENRGLVGQRLSTSLLSTHYSPFTIHYSPFTIHYSLFSIHYSLFSISLVRPPLPAPSLQSPILRPTVPS
ncbi:MAG: hypothetical protein DYG85_12885 [Chloroflexi bacterium CFX1]|nr:hypothetical protein [Chloroflexi bacterium CFX1]MCQ3952912.1 hypothetical protein [Chloroflexota bacterium]MDL1918237.1 hypothetical protein [Chloroflexi bacterium CFX5]